VELTLFTVLTALVTLTVIVLLAVNGVEAESATV
jgi:hypothetical protein